MTKIILAICALTLTLAGPVYPAVHSPIQNFSVSVERIGTKFIRFEVCEGGKCTGLGGGSGIFRIKDLEERHDLLINRSAEYLAYERKFQKALNIGGPIGILTALTSIYAIPQFAPAFAQTPAGLAAIIGSSAFGMLPFVTWVLYPLVLKPTAENHGKATANFLIRAMNEDFDVQSELALRQHLQFLNMALQSVESVTFCDAELES